jgi:3-hydroxyisobutyrate dehydrogenase-like beta-hydroxyacid dehydrogenase
MGARIARRLLGAGYAVVVWSRSGRGVGELVELGATRAGSPADAASQVDVVITMVHGPEALIDVVEGDEGVATASSPPRCLIEMSTVGPAAIGRVRATLPDATALIDAPVCGSIEAAEAGTLVILAGGSPDAIDQHQDLLAVLGEARRVGPSGSGAAAKLVANAALLGTVALLGETLRLGDVLGLDAAAISAALATSPLAAQAERRLPALVDGGFPPRFALRLARKDAGLVVDADRDLTICEATRDWLAAAEGAGLGERDYTAVLAHITRST